MQRQKQYWILKVDAARIALFSQMLQRAVLYDSDYSSAVEVPVSHWLASAVVLLCEEDSGAYKAFSPGCRDVREDKSLLPSYTPSRERHLLTTWFSVRNKLSARNFRALLQQASHNKTGRGSSARRFWLHRVISRHISLQPTVFTLFLSVY